MKAHPNNACAHNERLRYLFTLADRDVYRSELMPSRVRITYNDAKGWNGLSMQDIEAKAATDEEWQIILAAIKLQGL